MVPTVPPVGTQATQVATLVLHTIVPASLIPRQSESELHSTQVPVLLHTSASGLLARVQAVPALG